MRTTEVAAPATQHPRTPSPARHRRAYNATVTGALHAASMTSARARTGVCVVRVEAQAHGALITLRLIPDIERLVTGAESSSADAEIAIRIVREFLLSFFAERPDG